jgi:hypothetical protein
MHLEHPIYGNVILVTSPKLPPPGKFYRIEVQIEKERARRKKKSRGDGKWGRKVGSRMDSGNLGLIVLGIK